LALHRAGRNLVLALVEGKCVLHIASGPISQTGTSIEEHVHQRSVCDSALEILDEVHEPSSVNPLEDYYDPEKLHSFQSPGRDLEQFNKRSQIIFIDHSLFLFSLDSLIGPSGLLLVVSHLLPVLVSVLWVGFEKSL
jgi:hypothetical protein